MQIHRRALIAATMVPVAAGHAPPSHGREPSWRAAAPLPWPAQEVHAAVWNGRIAVAGGLVGRTDAPLHIEDRVGLYDPVADVWREGPRLPEPRHHPMMAVLGGDLWAIGGYGRGAGDWTNRTEVWRLSPGADAWRSGSGLPTPQAEAVGLAHAGRVHLITGRSPRDGVNGQWRDQIDVATHLVLHGDRWETARPCPMARNSAAGAVLEGALWIAGGRTVEGGGTGRLDRYDPAADRWDTVAPIPVSPASGRQVGGGLAMAALGGRLVAFGGEWFHRAAPGGGGVFAETWLYHPHEDVWRAGPPMRTPRHGLAAATVGGTVYAIAGGEVVSGGRAGGLNEALGL
ncbi:MAG: Kelch repeat-containing protein [Brevundimonas sp.]|uniref:Kelch repeat-containing protein n=1 Tax=Brevundimonas sp. TaxID=1871086 RepID=UPI00391DE556